MGPYLGTPNTEKDSESGNSDVCKWGATSMQGWRKSQEDAHIARTDLPGGLCFFGVFDGHGGKEVSMFVKEKFVDELVNLEEFKSAQYEQALKKCFRRMDLMMEEPEGKARMKTISEQHGSPDPFAGGMNADGGENPAKFCGCTATCILITPTQIICANAGDSRVVLGRGAGQMCEPLSDDHKPDNEQEKARIEAAGGFVEENRVNGSLALSRALGDFEYKGAALEFTEQAVTCDPDCKTVTRQAADQFVFLACDGIWDCLTSEEVVEQTRTSLASHPEDQPVTSIIEMMFDSIIAKDVLSSAGKGTDNMTAIIVQLKPKAG